MISFVEIAIWSFRLFVQFAWPLASAPGWSGPCNAKREIPAVELEAL